MKQHDAYSCLAYCFGYLNDSEPPLDDRVGKPYTLEELCPKNDPPLTFTVHDELTPEMLEGTWGLILLLEARGTDGREQLHACAIHPSAYGSIAHGKAYLAYEPMFGYATVIRLPRIKHYVLLHQEAQMLT